MNGKPIERIAVVHVNVPEDAQEFGSQLCEYLDYSGDVIVANLTAGLSVHSGSGMVGAAFVVAK